jgi:hypothetical protein
MQQAMLGTSGGDDDTMAAAAERLRDSGTRLAALDVFECHTAPIPPAAALAAAPALAELLTMDAAEVEHAVFDRTGLLLGRLFSEALPEALPAMYGAALGGDFFPKLYGTSKASNVVLAALRGPASQLTRADALSYACLIGGAWSEAPVRGFSQMHAAAGYTTMGFIKMWMTSDFMVSKKQMPEDDVPMRMMTLLLELLKSNELPERAVAGAWLAVAYCLLGRPGLNTAAVVECGLLELAVVCLNAIGSPADWVSRRGHVINAFGAIYAAGEVTKTKIYADRCVASGLFDLCIEAVAAFAAAGEDGLSYTDHGALALSLNTILRIWGMCTHPGREDKIRSIAGPLQFCLANDLDFMGEVGGTSMYATTICKCQNHSSTCRCCC